METYGKILLMATPAFFLLILFEKWWGWRKGQDTVHTMDMVSSILSGVTNAVKDVLGLAVVVLSYGWLVEHIALTKVPAGFLTYLVAFLALDFAGYCVHRISHQYNFFWTNHVIHHSSEEFNLACALRQSIAPVLKIFAFFLFPAALLGVPAQVIAVVAPLHLFAQFWYHTRHIDKLGWLEKIIVTPSHHRVHHAINPEYIDKNYSQIFIFWDKWFGTFQEELKDVPPVYGITRPVSTWNPIKINFQHLWLLLKDAWRTRSWKDKARIWLMPTGWRPADVAEKYPVNKIGDVYDFKKYEPTVNNFMPTWAWVQMFIILLLISYLFANVAAIGSPGIFIYGGFIYLAVYALTELMDGSPYALVWEIIKNALGVAVIIYTGTWFGASGNWYWIKYAMIVYFIASTLATAGLVRLNRQVVPVA